MSLFISYNREQKDFADKVESSVRTICPVLRDTNDIAPWGSIEEFMNRIRKADYAVLLISDEYLKSINCMYEACQLYKDVNWKTHTMYVVLGNADLNVYTVANHECYIRHWKDKKTMLVEQIKSLPAESIDSITSEIKRVSEILLMIGDFLKDIRDTNNLQPENTINTIIDFISTTPTSEETHLEGYPCETLSKTLKGDAFDNIFKEVYHTESLNLRNPHALRLFHLDVVGYSFSSKELLKFLRKNIGRYVYSRAKLEQFKLDDDVEGVRDEALRVMRQTGRPDEKGTGNELGEMLLYAFLEEKLDAPKLLSKVELSTGAKQYNSQCDSIHMHFVSTDSGVAYYQMVFGTSSVIGDLKGAIDGAFECVVKIENRGDNEVELVEHTFLNETVPARDVDFIRSILIPSSDGNTAYDTAYGIFLGYSIGLEAGTRTVPEYRAVVNKKMERDIQEYAKYIRDKIDELGLSHHSFYLYVMPLTDAEKEKREIMQSIMEVSDNG